MRAVVCLFGVLPRAINVTWPSIERRILAPLAEGGFATQLFLFNLDVQGAQVDGCALRTEDVTAQLAAHAPHVRYESATHAAADAAIDARCGSRRDLTGRCQFIHKRRPYYRPGTAQNALRQMYSARPSHMVHQSTHTVHLPSLHR